MTIPATTTATPSNCITRTLHSGWNAAKCVVLAPLQFTKAIFTSICGLDKSDSWFKVFYDKNIKPLSVKDFLIMGVFGAIALAIVFLVIPMLGKALFTLCVVMSIVSVLLGFAWVHNRNQNKLKLQAALHVDLIIDAVIAWSEKDQSTPIIYKQIGLLKNETYSLIQKEVRQLEKKINSAKRSESSLKTIREDLLAYLKDDLRKNLRPFESIKAEDLRPAAENELSEEDLEEISELNEGSPARGDSDDSYDWEDLEEINESNEGSS